MAGEGILDAVDVARGSNHQVESEHLMKAILEQKGGLARRIFKKAGIDHMSVLQATDDFISQQPIVHDKNLPVLGSNLKSVLENAKKYKKRFGDDFLSVGHLFLAFHSDRRFGQSLFRNLQLSKKELKDAVRAVRGNQRETDQNHDQKHEALEKYGNDLTEHARRGKLDPVIGRDDEIELCIEILLSRTEKNAIIIGDSGIRKTVVAEGLAQKIVSGDVPEPLLNHKLISLDMGSLVAGPEFGGDFAERLKAVLKGVTASNDQIIIFIAEIHTVVAADDTSDAMDASILLKSILGRDEIRCIGATTLTEYKKYIEKDPSLDGRFQQVFCGQSSVEETISILRELRQRRELLHGVKISDSALVAAAVLADRYIRERFLPGKAIDLVDQAAAKSKMERTYKPIDLDAIERAIVKLRMEKLSLLNDTDKASKERLSKMENDLSSLEQKHKELTELWRQGKALITQFRSIKEEIGRVTLEIKAAEHEYDLNRAVELKYGTMVSLQHQLEASEKCLADFRKFGKSLHQEEVTDIDIAVIISRRTGIPLSSLQQSERDKMVSLEKFLEKRIVGQDIAVRSVARAIQRAWVGLSNPNRPLASFMFIDPTDLGKTELAKALADYLFNTERAFVRLSMGLYREKHSVSQLIETVRRRPYSVVLFDQIEKAHHDVFSILLRILDDGRITDSTGRTISFANCIVIMTSNIGSHYILETLKNPVENKKVMYGTMKRHVVELARQTHSAEFMNRFDDFIVFLPLDSNDVGKIAEIEMNRLKVWFNERKMGLHYTGDVVRFLSTLGSDPIFGARSVEMEMANTVESDIALGYLRGDFKEGDSALIDAITSEDSPLGPLQKRLVVRKLENSSVMNVVVSNGK